MLAAGRRLPKLLIDLICCGAVGLAFLDSWMLAPGTYRYAEWIPAIGADWCLLLDELSLTMVRMVTGISLLIHIYSTGYMKGDGGYARYFGYLNLFVFFMLLLVMSANYALAFAGWEGVGLASYLLIGYFIEKPKANAAATKAFLMNRAGDAAFLLAIFLMIGAAGTVEYSGVAQRWSALYMSPVVLLLAFAAAGKSAQIPLYTWLPDAMEGPTPVSALIHAATMVTAGVYLLVRSAALVGDGSEVILWTGLATAILAGLLASVERDIKRVLAYSTVSQLGLMFAAIGAGALPAAMLHLLTHAFFKAALFLGAGSVIHGLHGEQDLAFMGGLRRKMPWTFRMMLVAVLAIMGVPGFSGFFSKEPIITAAFHASAAAGVAALIVSGLTAFYMWRLMRKAFFGETRSTAQAHESPLSMLLPMAVLAIGSVAAGWGPMHLDWPILIAALAVTAAGAWAAQAGVELPVALRHLHVLDWVWTTAAARWFAIGGGRSLHDLDGAVIDGAVNGSATSARAASRASMFGDRWVVDGAVRLIGISVRLSSYPARLLQTGWLQSYALVFLAGVAVLLGWAFTR